MQGDMRPLNRRPTGSMKVTRPDLACVRKGGKGESNASGRKIAHPKLDSDQTRITHKRNLPPSELWSAGQRR